MRSENNTTPDYKQIYTDIINKKYPHKKKDCESILQKKIISGIDIVELNKRIFGTDREREKLSQKYRSYNKTDILKILDYQKKNKLNNSQLADHFGLSRNTVGKWRKYFYMK